MSIRSAVTTRRLVVTAALAVVGLGATACSSGTSAASQPAASTLRVGQLGAAQVTKALLEIAGEAPTSYGVDYSLYPAGPAFMEAVPSGKVDFAFMADTPSIFAQAAGLPVKIVTAGKTLAPDTSTVEVLVPAGSSATTLAQLKGKKIATTQATILQYTLVKALEKAGLSYTDVTPVLLSPPDAVAALQSGSVDAITALDPQLSQLKAGGARAVANGVGLTSGLEVGVATTAALADRTKVSNLTDFVQRYQRAEAWATQHKTEWAARYAKITGLAPEIAKAVVARQAYTPVPIDATIIAGQQKQADAFASLGLLKTKLDVTAEFDTKLNAGLFGGAK